MMTPAGCELAPFSKLTVATSLKLVKMLILAIMLILHEGYQKHVDSLLAPKRFY